MNALFELYQNTVVFLLYVLFGITLLLIFYSVPHLTRILKSGLKNKTIILLLILFLVGFAIRILIMPKIHLMYIDEPLYIDQASNINRVHKPVSCIYENLDSKACYMPFQKAPGWSFLLSILFWMTGVNETAAFYLAGLLGTLCILLVFFIIYFIFEDQKIALWGAFLLSLSPLYVKWSTTIETNIPSLFFLLFSLLLFLSWLRHKHLILLLCCLSVFTLSIFIRYENILFVFIFALAYLLLRQQNDQLANQMSRTASLMLASLLLIISFQFYAIRYIIQPFAFVDYYFINTIHFVKTLSLDFWLLPFFCLGLIAYIHKSDNKFLFTLLGFLMFFILYLPFFRQGRMALLPGIFLIMMVAYAIEHAISLSKHTKAIRIAIAVPLCILLLHSLYSSYHTSLIENPEFILEMKTAKMVQMEVDNSCYLISEYPVTVLYGTDIKGMRTSDSIRIFKEIENAISNGQCIFYLSDSYCSDRKISRSRITQKTCSSFTQRFDLIKKKDVGYGNEQYTLYRVNGVKS